jgi:adenylate cyclase
LLVEFASVTDAVACAAEIQALLADRNADISAERRIEIRIGINVGDVIVEDGDIFGDGVNIAARLEGLADPGRNLRVVGGARSIGQPVALRVPGFG